MKYPDFFDSIEHILIKDELSKFLGTTEDGLLEISYLEIVKMAGHSCATVAGAYLMTLYGLKALYPGGIPERGDIKVELKNKLEEGNTGVVATVISNITGATSTTGFSGLQGMFNRRGLMFFGAGIDANIRFTSLSKGTSVDVSYYPQKVVNPKEIMMTYFGPEATPESKKAFPQKWQQMVKKIFDNAATVIEVS